MSNTFTTVAHPLDLKYQMDRRRQIDECLKMSEQELDRQVRYLMQTAPIRDDHSMRSKIFGEMYNRPDMPRAVKGILDSTSGTTGNVLIRQDLEPTLYA